MNIAVQDVTEKTARSVRATINYSVPRDRIPVYSNREGETDLNLAPFEMSVFDASTFATAPRLEVEGFTMVPNKVEIGNLLETTDIESQSRIFNSYAALMLELTGADEIIVTPSCLIRRQEGTLRPSERKPVHFVHSDTTLSGAASTIAKSYNFATRAKIRRTVLFNMWKLLSEGPTNRPLALCDARSVAPEDIIDGESRHHFATFGTAFLRHNPDHRWAYYPGLVTDQLLVFKQSDTDPDRPRVVPHVSFDDKSQLNAKPRISMETRCLGVWYE